jgi:hypothetical protein
MITAAATTRTTTQIATETGSRMPVTSRRTRTTTYS